MSIRYYAKLLLCQSVIFANVVQMSSLIGNLTQLQLTSYVYHQLEIAMDSDLTQPQPYLTSPYLTLPYLT